MDKWDEINIKTEYMTGLISKVINKVMKKKFQRDMNIQLNELTITDQEDTLRLHLSVDAEIMMSELEVLLKGNGVI